MKYVGRYFMDNSGKIWLVEDFEATTTLYKCTNEDEAVYVANLETADWLVYKKKPSIDVGNRTIWTVNLVLWMGLIYLYTMVG